VVKHRPSAVAEACVPVITGRTNHLIRIYHTVSVLLSATLHADVAKRHLLQVLHVLTSAFTPLSHPHDRKTLGTSWIIRPASVPNDGPFLRWALQQDYQEVVEVVTILKIRMLNSPCRPNHFCAVVPAFEFVSADDGKLFE